MAPLLGLATAFGFGISDVTGAVATRRSGALAVALGIQATGLLALVPALWLVPGTPSTRALVIGAAAGLVGNLGLVLYLRCMALGPIGVITPIAALVAAALPVTWGVVVAGEVLAPRQSAGVVLGMIAVVAVAWTPGTSIATALRESGSRGPLTALVAGATFGAFFVILDATPDGSGLWPLLGSRVLGVTPIVLLALLTGRALVVQRPARRLTAISGLADVAANAFFLLAVRIGLLSLVSLLASLGPVVSLLVARYWLHERLSPLQIGGVVMAMVATGLLVL